MPGMRPSRVPIPVPRAIGIAESAQSWRVSIVATIGGITPPVGSLLFVACSIGRVGLTEALRPIWPFVVALVLVNALLILFPAVTTIVPQLFFD
jgi:TRAP-type C4-dicarboxylate transport system permease large subunit